MFFAHINNKLITVASFIEQFLLLFVEAKVKMKLFGVFAHVIPKTYNYVNSTLVILDIVWIYNVLKNDRK